VQARTASRSPVAVTTFDAKVKLPLKVVPGSSRNGIVGWLGDALRVKVTAAAERGMANAAVEALLSEALALPRGAVKIVAGASSPRKDVEIAGLPETEIRRRLAAVE
jgi:uncharacterized protein (TIGR00251 family)